MSITIMTYRIILIPHHHHVTTTRICNPYSHLTYLTLIFPQQPGIKGKLHQLEVVPRNGLVAMTIIIIGILSHYPQQL